MKLFCILSLLTFSAIAVASEPAAKPPAPPATTVSVPAPAATTLTAPVVSPAVMKILRAMEEAGKTNVTIKADIDYHLDKKLVGDITFRTGNVVFSSETSTQPARFRVNFATLKRNKGKTTAVRLDYAFGGMWLSKADYSLRQITRYQYAAKGQRANPLRLGEGPFPMPFGQKVADVLKYFEVTLTPVAPKDPENTYHLQFMTRRIHRRKISYVSLQLWVDRKTHLPVKIRVKERKSPNITTVTFKNTKSNVKLDDATFILPRPKGWKEILKPFQPPSSRTGVPPQRR